MDKRALRILFDTYWTSKGWKDERSHRTAPEDFAYAKAAGVMFDLLELGHDETLKRFQKVRDGIEPRQVADAFLASLSSRRLSLRSALGSFAVFRHLDQHKPIFREKTCQICGQYQQVAPEDLNVLNLERFKWGGVRHDDLLYAMFDLECFEREEQCKPQPEDIEIFKILIKATETAPPEITSAHLHTQWSKFLKSNKPERDAVVAILGFCGILGTAEHPGYRSKFIPVMDRDLPNRHYIDMAYPACWWTAKDGIDYDALHEWFGHVL